MCRQVSLEKRPAGLTLCEGPAAGHFDAWNASVWSSKSADLRASSPGGKTAYRDEGSLLGDLQKRCVFLRIPLFSSFFFEGNNKGTMYFYRVPLNNAHPYFGFWNRCRKMQNTRDSFAGCKWLTWVTFHLQV